MVAICTPSRGLIFSKCVQGIIEGMQALNGVGIATIYCYTHELPIPDCHNATVEKALANSAVDRIFFIEEDMYVDPQTFIALATSEHDIVTVNYNDRNGSVNGIIHYDETGEILWSGLGATVIKRRVFEAIGTPYFRTDHRYKSIKKATSIGRPAVTHFEEIEPRTEWDAQQNKTVVVRDEAKYGMLDVDFYYRARQRGFKIVCLQQFRAYQFELIQLGESYNNKGCHVIRQV